MKLLRSSRPSLEVFGTCPDIYHLIASHQMHEIGWRHCVQCLQQVNKMQIFTQFLATDGKWLILAQYTKEVSIFVVSYLRLNNWYWSYHSLPWGYSKMLCGGTVGKIDGCRTSDGRTDSRFGISSERERERFAWSCQIPERAKSCGVPLKCTALRLMILGVKRVEEGVSAKIKCLTNTNLCILPRWVVLDGFIMCCQEISNARCLV